jgi:hypothetical protein
MNVSQPIRNRFHVIKVEISGRHGDEDLDCGLLGYDIVYQTTRCQILEDHSLDVMPVIVVIYHHLSSHGCFLVLLLLNQR